MGPLPVRFPPDLLQCDSANLDLRHRRRPTSTLSLYDELRAEADHGAISRLLYHQQTQELLLIRLAEKLDVNTRNLMPMLTTLAGREERNSSGNGLHASPGGIE
jgi:hypothetical protein